MFNDLQGRFFLRSSHGFYAGTNLGVYPTFEKADEKAKEILELRINEMQKALGK